ncbi:uncharacterized protein KNAG_0D02060 [Huiozyma naganishii CBS 8797]|uniref:UBR-type domain-containing protein n=1 Tax=Huiozyma naganishii (strain ATCC MYA-139 / BCRC 22969 / CBS 8797 / KCTC 17520 / NBRC 10181 / NCYC 3082 / Yp74L-3) TaxID=1071383 RepID=J7RXX0_HUIN7|nr:hypothetical protein KNAG_0D02060 [Kazachstania naganishii CBS 8797]CCK69957.1 hypothetical protein KNAG_0D02060 [Kazachstania naganishii CBS 8797]
MDNITIPDFISQQAALEQEARELMPWEPKSCTYEKGPFRQQIFACRTHNNIGVCYSCSIRCHTSCDLVELFTKRHFTCDCGTERDNRVQQKDAIRCEIRKNTSDDIPASDNVYNQNFKGLFCDCAKEYDPDNAAVMLQCAIGLQCNEDWYHDHCIMGKTKSESQEMRRVGDEDTLERPLEGFPDLESFEAYICWKCYQKYEYYFQRLLSHELADDLFACKLSRNEGAKVELINEHGKRTNHPTEKPEEYSLFLKPNYSSVLKKIKEGESNKSDKLFIFLDILVPFLIKDEPIYDPGQDEDDPSMAIFDLAAQALQVSVRRDQAVQGIEAFHSLKENLNQFLKSFAEKKKVVAEEDIKSFFQNSK